MLTKPMILNLLEGARRYPPDLREYEKMANSHLEVIMHIDNMAKRENELKDRVAVLEDALRRTIAVPEVREALSSTPCSHPVGYKKSITICGLCGEQR